MLARTEQESAEAPALRIYVAQIVLLQQNGEKSLGEVLRFFARQSLATDKSVEGIPVMGAHDGQSAIEARVTLAPGRKDDGPMRSGEVFTANGIGGWLVRDHASTQGFTDGGVPSGNNPAFVTN